VARRGIAGDIAVRIEDIADRLGLKQYPRSWRGDCPCCSYGRAFSLRQRTQNKISAFCANGCSHEALDDMLRRVLGNDWRPWEKPDDDTVKASRERKQHAAQKLFAGAVPLPDAGDCPATRYLQGRHIECLLVSTALRWRTDVTHPDPDGNHIATHRTYLMRDGTKRTDVEARATLGTCWGGAVRLQDPRAGQPLVIGEGIESSASAGVLLALPAWAAVSSANLAAGLVLPPNLRAVVIASDNDALDRHGKRPGQEAAAAAAKRWQAEGRHVRIARPRIEGADFNDVLCARGGA
jgi:putative DNA primase/helicase